LAAKSGNRALERLGHFDAHFAVILGHHQQHAITHVFAPDFPLIAYAVGVAGDVFRLRTWAPSA
jgi:hypothetical protein